MPVAISVEGAWERERTNRKAAKAAKI